ncbi:MAG: GNAT family N-acetyltransferase [Lachnospiraceae bacterium]
MGWKSPCGPGGLIDDSELVAYIHDVLVDPVYHGRGIAGSMIKMVKEKYKCSTTENGAK